MKIYCSHHRCVVDAVADLLTALQAKRQLPADAFTPSGLRARYKELSAATVRCRIVPRKGAVDAPLPEPRGGLR